MSKIKFENTEVAGILPALRGMRNPLNSWSKSDTKECNEFNCSECICIPASNECCGYNLGDIIIGKNDLDLAKRLITAGAEHAKFLRQIQVWVDITQPRYWWGEFDTYKFNTKNSCSTMHKLLNNKEEITKDDFYYNSEVENTVILIAKILDEYRLLYLKSKDAEEKNKLLIKAKQILLESFLQLRTVNTNYAELRNIYKQRKNHKLKNEWGAFCKWVEGLPYAKDLIIN